MPDHSRSQLRFRLFAAIFASAAAYHLMAAAMPSLAIPGSRWRHALFVAIDTVFAGLMLWRPPWLMFPLAALTLQALYSHGRGALLSWREHGQVNWLSIGLLVVLPIILGFVVRDGRQQRARTASGEKS